MCVAAIVSGNRSYEAVQCILNTQQCFCVDHSGREIDGTRRLSDEGRPNCTDRSTYTLENGSIEIGVVPSTSRVDYDHWCRQIGYCRPEQGKKFTLFSQCSLFSCMYTAPRPLTPCKEHVSEILRLHARALSREEFYNLSIWLPLCQDADPLSSRTYQHKQCLVQVC